MKKVTVQISLSVPARIKKRQKWFVASCPVLDVASQGETEEQLYRCTDPFLHQQ